MKKIFAVIAFLVVLGIIGGAIAIHTQKKTTTVTVNNPSPTQVYVQNPSSGINDNANSNGRVAGESTTLNRDENSKPTSTPTPSTKIVDSSAVPTSKPAATAPVTPAPAPRTAPAPTTTAKPTYVAASSTEKIYTIPSLKFSVTVPNSWYADPEITNGNEIFFRDTAGNTFGSIEVFPDANETLEQVYNDLTSDPAVTNVRVVSPGVLEFYRNGLRQLGTVHSGNVYFLKGELTNMLSKINFI